MSLLTKNYKLLKPELTDAPPDITAMNPNWDTVDELLKTLSEDSGVVISPTEPETGDVWIDTDDDSSGGGGVTSVNNQTGDVIIDARSLDVYTKTETNNLLDQKSNSNHTHTLTALGAAPAYTYGTSDMTAGQTALETGKIYLMYE